MKYPIPELTQSMQILDALIKPSTLSGSTYRTLASSLSNVSGR